MSDRRERRRAVKRQTIARGEFARSLQERFAAEGAAEISDAVDGSDDVLAALYGVCPCGQAYRETTTWTLAGDTITGWTDAQCGNGHAMTIPFNRCGSGWIVITEMGRVMYGGAR